MRSVGDQLRWHVDSIAGVERRLGWLQRGRGRRALSGQFAGVHRRSVVRRIFGRVVQSERRAGRASWEWQGGAGSAAASSSAQNAMTAPDLWTSVGQGLARRWNTALWVSPPVAVTYGFFKDAGTAFDPSRSTGARVFAGGAAIAAILPGLQELKPLEEGLAAFSTAVRAGEGVGGATTTLESAGLRAESALQGSLLNQQLAAEDVAGARMPSEIGGYTSHGLDQAISREGVGVSVPSILDSFNNPLSIAGQSGGRVCSGMARARGS